ncbi:MAG: chorismate-binding protein [Ignavibacteriales bacterium]|nr:chorismate-binding protein [Ignavibacteriales bacterium]
MKSFIEEGDTYQVNYTVKGKFNFEGSYSGLFSNLVFNQSAKYTSIINNGNKIIISLSPELFFEIEERKIISKPMKGTSQRGVDLPDDSLLKYQLGASSKNCAENVMIIDLIRNDLGRISEYGSVKVKSYLKLRSMNQYFQMVSTIESKLKKNIRFSDVIKIFSLAGQLPARLKSVRWKLLMD